MKIKRIILTLLCVAAAAIVLLYGYLFVTAWFI